MWQSKDIYYVSGSTCILAEDLGRAMLSQFPEISFNSETIPFIRTIEDAERARDLIKNQSTGRYPLVFSTIMDHEINTILDIAEVEYFSVCAPYLKEMEQLLEAKALWQSGHARHLDTLSMGKRVEAIHYSISHDDGSSMKDYDEAEIILLGVSRSGKTPISIYLATQMGIKTANYPLVADDLNSYRLPPDIVRNKERTVALSTKPEILHSIRQKRYKDSNYAKLVTCRDELNQANQIYLKYSIPVILSDGRSIEETATQVAQMFKLKGRLQ